MRQDNHLLTSNSVGASAYSQMNDLYAYLQPKVLARRQRPSEQQQPGTMASCATRLTATEQRRLMGVMFSVDDGFLLPENQKKLLKSNIEMGFPASGQ